MALPSALPQISDLGALLGSLGGAVVDIPLISVPFTTIQNRSQMYDLSKDLGMRMGGNRIMVQQLYPVDSEAGSNGEQVWAPVNDPFNQIRYVGNWLNLIDTVGQRSFTVTNNNYIEVTFYGTGLNMLGRFINGASDIRVTIDNGIEGASIVPTPLSGILDSRGYNSNAGLNLVTGLALGTHTARIRCVNAATSSVAPFGFEVLNPSSSVITNVGTIWNNGKKLYNAVQSSLTYNTGFESGVLGSRGGRVAQYIKADGSIAKSLTPTNTSQANLTSADHTNEEVSRIYHWREFGASRADDFSLFLVGGAANKAFTLDDGTTTLTGTGQVVQGTNGNAGEVLGFGVDGTFFTLTFVGTGLDIIRESFNGSTDVSSVTINGANVGSLASSFTASQLIREKVVSGLPYGTHTVKFTRTAGGSAHVKIKQFVTYQPKTPTIPSGAVQIGAYNILADYVANTVAGVDTTAIGTLRKQNMRELICSGTLSTNLAPSTQISGWDLFTTTNGDYVQHTFFGTGLEFRYAVGAGGADTATVTLDGVTNLTVSNGSFWTGSLTTSAYGAGSTFTASTGVISAPANSSAYGISIRGLNLGIHTIRIAKTSGAGNWFWAGLDIITPIHSQKSNSGMVYQNTLSVGSTGIEDLRKTIGQVFARNSYIAQGVTLNPTGGTNGVNRPLEEMSVTAKTTTGKFKVYFSNTYTSATQNAQAEHKLYINGVYYPPSSYPSNGAATGGTGTMSIDVVTGPGTHKFDVIWLGNGNTLTSSVAARVLSVKEID